MCVENGFQIQSHNYVLNFTDIIREVRIKGPRLSELLITPLELLEDECINCALLAAVESDSPSNTGKLILHGATNIDEALEKSRKLHHHEVTAVLLITKAAMENDKTLVLRIYGENIQGQEIKIPFTEEDDLDELRVAMHSYKIEIRQLIEICKKYDCSVVKDELLLRTDVDKHSGVVLWLSLGLRQLEVSWLRKIEWVKYLILSKNKLITLPPSIGSYLKQCTKLNLCDNSISKIPKCLLELPSINTLDLSHNHLKDIPNTSKWSLSLSILDLSYNSLSDLPNFVIAPALEDLNISNNRFCFVPRCICSFTGLTALNIANNHKIRSLPLELGWLKNLLNLKLNGLNHLSDPPKNARATTTDCVHYLNSQLRNARGYYHMKMMLIGNQAVGKSTIVAQLHNKDISSEFRFGVNVSEWKYKAIHFRIWDFSGQEEYHAIYQCFFSKRSLYLLVWNVTEGDAGIAGLKPWLNNILLRAPDSCVIVVGTFLDKVSEEDRQSGIIDDLLNKVEKLTRHYRRLVVTNITAVGMKGNMENLSKLKNYIYNAAVNYKIKNQFVISRKVPYSYHTLDSKLSAIYNLVKNGHHEPIMHVANFWKMVRDLNLVDIHNNDELRAATYFLHEVGALLYYDYQECNLDYLYFIDPCWLWDLLSTIVSIKQHDPNSIQGIVKSKSIPCLFKGKYFPDKYFHQILALLNKFEIAYPIDNDYNRILVPSMLPKMRPDIDIEQLVDINNYYKRYFLFNLGNPQVQYSTDLDYHKYTHSTPPGLWNRILSRIMITVQEVRDVLNQDVLDHITEAGLMPITTSVIMFSVRGNESLMYWHTGLFCNVKKLIFSIESLADSSKYHDKDGIVIFASKTVKGCKILSQMIDIVEQLISEWYPGLNSQQRVPCSECIKTNISYPYEFKINQLLSLIAENKLTYKCGADHEIKLIEIVPDLLFQDLNQAFILDPKKIIYKQEEENLLKVGNFGKVYYASYKNEAVTLKIYVAKECSRIEEDFKKLHLQSKLLQQMQHPSLVHMVGVTIHPTMSLVLEEAPEGSLQVPLIREHRSFSRIILYRIAIQVASALHFLHSINIMHRNLKADNVLLWSLSPDHLINCKVTDFNNAVQTNPEGTRGLHGTKGFIAPEISRVNYAKNYSVYNHMADIFSFGMFLYQLVARRVPFHNIQPYKIETTIERGHRPQLEDIMTAEIGLYYMTRVMKLCWAENPIDRPAAEQIVHWMSASSLQLIVSVVPLSSKCSICNGCIVAPVTSNKAGLNFTSSELWICCNGDEGTELSIFTTNTMVKAGKHLIKETWVSYMKECGENVWIFSRVAINVFNKSAKDLIYATKIKEATVSCITNSDQFIYVGTEEGSCFVFSTDVNIQTNALHHYKYNISEHCIDGLALGLTWLWISICNQIHFVNPANFELESVKTRAKNADAFVGKMMPSDDGYQMWSAHLGGVVISAWNARQRTHIVDVDVGVLAEENCHIGDPRDRIMTAMCTALDTVWIGLANGFIMVFGMNPPGELLTYFRPYNSSICFLSASKYPGPCQKEECMMLCGGKMYRPDDSFKELRDYEREDKKGVPVDTAGVAVLWEVLPAKYTRQAQYLSKGTAWLNYSTLKETMTDTGFTESMRHCSSLLEDTQTVTTLQDDALFKNKDPCNSQRDCIKQHDSEHERNKLNNLSNDLSILTNNTTGSEEIVIDYGRGYQVTLTCEQPVTLNSVINKIKTETSKTGYLLLTYHFDDGNELVTINTNEQMEHYLQLPERPNLHIHAHRVDK